MFSNWNSGVLDGLNSLKKTFKNTPISTFCGDAPKSGDAESLPAVMIFLLLGHMGVQWNCLGHTGSRKILPETKKKVADTPKFWNVIWHWRSAGDFAWRGLMKKSVCSTGFPTWVPSLGPDSHIKSWKPRHKKMGAQPHQKCHTSDPQKKCPHPPQMEKWFGIGGLLEILL